NAGYPNAKNWMVTALIAKWGVDQLIKNSVSINLGKDTLQFIIQPDGAYTPPANCTAVLTHSAGAYKLEQRHGNKFNFDTLGRLDNITDQYGRILNVNYTNNNLVSTIKDWQSRLVTLRYNNNQLATVSDGTRTVTYHYSTAYNAQGDLTSVSDPEGKTTTYVYDGNHQITATIDAASRLVVSNLYDSQGHVATQYTEGVTNKTWHVYWSGMKTTMVDPGGGETDYYYDTAGRLAGVVDPLNHVSATSYDGQNHVIQTVSPLNETNRFLYDGSHNLIFSVDPLGFTNQFVYDSGNHLTRSVDARGNISKFGYNSHHSLTGQTNGAGGWVNYDYNDNGTLRSLTDAGYETDFNYDNKGQLETITYPGSLGVESFENSPAGDVISHTDAESHVTTFNYNARRELTNTTAPGNFKVRVGYDAVGNVINLTDARGFTTSNTWSATRHLLTTTLPGTPQGVPVITNTYDNRDWLIRTVNPQQATVSYTNDAAGRLLAMTDPVQRTTRFGYDAAGRKIATTNAQQEVTSQTFDARGSLLKLTDGAGHFSLRSYDAAGNQVILTNRNGKKWQFQFDGANRLTNTLTPLGRTMGLTFDKRGLVKTVCEPSGELTTNIRDPKGRLFSRADSVATTHFDYDNNDRVTGVTESGKTNSWDYDAHNHLSSYRDVSGNLIQYRYDASGNLTNLVYPGGKTVKYAYDSLNRMTNVTDWSGRRTGIAYDLNSHLTSLVRPNGSYRTVGYDAAGQATNILEQMGNSLPIAIFKLNWTNSGSMAWEFAAPLPHAASIPTRNMDYDDDNRLATVNGSAVTNDLDGNLIYAPLTSGVFTNYAYDPRNRLLNAGGVTNAYDAINNRIGITSGTNSTVLVVNPNAKLPQVLMRIKNGVTNYYVYGAGLLYEVTETATATNTRTYHYDYRGSTIALSADNGLVIDRIEYSA
ncbi:MAG: hypothetical protein WCS42_22225, partial [Verrucomicrobiota bacterium]